MQTTKPPSDGVENSWKPVKGRVRSLGVQKKKVYDIEVADHHNFFANDILVHNSLYVRMKTIADRNPGNEMASVMELSDTISKVIDHAVKILGKRLNAYDNRWSFKRETISSRGVWTGKKRYILDMLVSEAAVLAEPELKVTGIEAVRSTTPEWARDRIKTALKVIMRQDEAAIQSHFKKLRADFMGLRPEDMAIPCSVSKLNKYIDVHGEAISGTPQHIKSAINYNKCLTVFGVSNRYPVVNQGDKIKYVILKKPNPIRESTIAFHDFLPPEFDLDAYIDREAMFDRVVKTPLKRITDAMQWDIEKKQTLAKFFKAR